MTRTTLGFVAGVVAVFLAGTKPTVAHAQGGKAIVRAHIDDLAAEYGEIAQTIWDYAEVGYQEEQSSALLQSTLEAAGFSLEVGVAEIPTAFVASWGSGHPIVGLLAEFDALPGTSQDRVPVQQQIPGLQSGHACGHHLFGTGSTAAAIAVKEWMDATNTPGTVRLYGTPAEEGGAGKVYMVRAGLFDDVDAVLQWHAGDENSAGVESSLANKSAKFRFHGVAAHAAGAPHRARSALDGVEAMNMMVNMMREHVPQETRIHYVITDGGWAPNTTPDFAEVFYYTRNPDPANVLAIFERVVKAAEGAALGTGTTVDYEIIHGLYALLPNEALGRAMHANLEQVGGVEYDETEFEFARTLQASLPDDSPLLETAAQVAPFYVREEAGAYSTDAGDVSWIVPATSLTAATWVPGTAAHSWQAIAAGGMSIGNKGMLVAAKTLAMTAVDLLTNPELVAAARAEHERRRGPDFVYVPLLGDRDPPLDYRRKP
jgi:aminobenzoyl-glutamate utilization protein B